MKRVIVVLSLAAFVLVWPLAAEHTKPFKMTLWGTGGIPLGSVIEGNPLGLGLCKGNSNLGKFDCTTTGYTTLGPSSIACPLDEEGNSGHPMEFVKTVQIHTIRFDNGDVLSMVPDNNAYNYACFYDGGMVATQWVTWKIVGGSGRFKGATGWAQWVLTGDRIISENLLSQWAARPGPFMGEITLQGSGGHGHRQNHR